MAHIVNNAETDVSSVEYFVQFGVRIRPFLTTDKPNDVQCTFLDYEGHRIVVGDTRSFFPQYMFSMHSQQHDIYQCVEPLLDKLFQGYNASVILYGQPKSGKSYTFVGPNIYTQNNDPQSGLAQRAATSIFERIRWQPNNQFAVTTSLVEVYHESIWDLLSPNQGYQPLIVKEGECGNVVISGLNEIECQSPLDVVQCLQTGLGLRFRARQLTTNCSVPEYNSTHVFFVINLYHKVYEQNSIRHQRSQFVLVELGNTEQFGLICVCPKEFRKSMIVNRANGVASRPTRLTGHVSQSRSVDNKLTQLLRYNIGGNSFSLVLCCVSPASLDFEETLRNLSFGEYMSYVSNLVYPNVSWSVSDTVHVQRRDTLSEVPDIVDENSEEEEVEFGSNFAASCWQDLVSSAERILANIANSHLVSDQDCHDIQTWLCLKEEFEECLTSRTQSIQKQYVPLQVIEEISEGMTSEEKSDKKDDFSEGVTSAETSDKEWAKQTTSAFDAEGDTNEVWNQATEKQLPESDDGADDSDISMNSSDSREDDYVLEEVNSKMIAFANNTRACVETADDLLGSPDFSDEADNFEEDLQGTSALPQPVARMHPVIGFAPMRPQGNRRHNIHPITLEQEVSNISELLAKSEVFDQAKPAPGVRQPNSLGSKLKSARSDEISHSGPSFCLGQPRVIADANYEVSQSETQLANEGKPCTQQIREFRPTMEELREQIEQQKSTIGKRITFTVESKITEAQCVDKQTNYKESSAENIGECSERDLTTVSDVQRKDLIRLEIQKLRKLRERLMAERIELDEKFHEGEALTLDEERRVLELDEAGEAIDHAIEYKNELLCGRNERILISAIAGEQIGDPLVIQLMELPRDELQTLFFKYFHKVVDLREVLRKMEMLETELESQREALAARLRMVISAQQQTEASLQRRMANVQHEAEQRVSLLLRHFGQGDSSGSSSIEQRIRHLEKKLHYYKNMAHELRRRVRTEGVAERGLEIEPEKPPEEVVAQMVSQRPFSHRKLQKLQAHESTTTTTTTTVTRERKKLIIRQKR